MRGQCPCTYIGKDDLGFMEQYPINDDPCLIRKSTTINRTSNTTNRMVHHGPKAGPITLANTPLQSDRQPPHMFRLDLNSVKSEDASPLVKMSAY